MRTYNYFKSIFIHVFFFRIMPAKAKLVLLDFLQVGVGEHVPADEKKSD